MSEPCIGIGVVEDSPELRQTLAGLIVSAPGFSLVGSWSSAEAAIEGAMQARPRIMLVDIHLPGLSGVECVRQLKPRLPDTEFMMLTVFDEHDQVYASLVAGATGYLIKRTRPEELLRAIRELHEGGSPMSSSIARAVVAAFAHALRPPSNVDAPLSGRESEILERLGSGMRYKEIADALNLSVHTVRTHLHNIYRKLQVNSKGEALQILREGRVGPEGAAPGFNPFRRRML